VAPPARPAAPIRLAPRRRHNFIRWPWPRLMRHMLSLGAVRTLPRRMAQPTLSGRLVAFTGRAHGLTPCVLRTADAVDLAAVAAAADQHQSTTAFACEQPARRFRWRMLVRTWTASATFATRRPHACTTRCEGTVPSPAWQLGRRRACLSGRLSRAICTDARRMRAASRASIRFND
jgi:hypothetical protein